MTKLGKAFPDFLQRGHTRKVPRNMSEEPATGRSSRLFALVIGTFLTFVILEARLFRLAITEGVAHRLRSDSNRLLDVVIPAPRGIIFDRNGTPITRNIPFYRKKLPNCPTDNFLCEEVISPDEARLTIARGGEDTLIYRIGREYILGSSSAHLTGYIGEINKQELEDAKTYSPGDLLGRGGIEEIYEKELRGTDGKELVEIDALGKQVKILGQIPPVSGTNVNLTIDSDLQKVAGSLIASESGAIVVSVPETGEILALASGPSYDPNMFVRGDDEIFDVLQNDKRPLFNRAISGVYPPGSTFKIVTAGAALEEKKLTPDKTIEDTGVIKIGPYAFHNWYFTKYGKTEGAISLVRAIARSNDVFFYRTGELVGAELLASWARKFGLGKTSGIDLSGEEAGLVPDTAWKRETMGEDWFLGDTFHYAIGQGNLLTTPLQVNTMMQVIANGGKLCRPHVRRQEARDRKQETGSRKQEDQECKDVGISQDNLNVIKEGMKGACSPGGTAFPLFKFKVKSEKLKIDGVNFLQTYESTTSAKPMVEIPVACKTGTAEYGDPKGRTHAWLTAFAPVESPRIAVTVLVEGGGEGSSVAAPIAKKILENWFSR